MGWGGRGSRVAIGIKVVRKEDWRGRVAPVAGEGRSTVEKDSDIFAVLIGSRIFVW